MILSKALYRVAYFLGLTKFFAWLHRNQVVILCYHGVTRSNHKVSSDPWDLTMDVRNFESQLKFLHKHYNVISLQSFLDAQRKRASVPPYSVVLTFDDGPRNFYTLASPLLEKFSLPATVFVITDFIDEMSRQRNGSLPIKEWGHDDDHLYLSWAEIRDLHAKQSIDFGSHSCTHPRLNLLAPQAAQRELRDSMSVIRRNTNQKRVAFSYPNGQASPQLARLVKKSGYTCGLTTAEGNNGISSDPFLFRRAVVESGDDITRFAARVANLTSYWPAFRSLCRPFIKHLVPALPDFGLGLATSPHEKLPPRRDKVS